jgi:putative salt-induced outer membrane protein
MHYIFVLFLFFSGNAFAQYTNESELAYVQSGGNSEVSTANAKSNNVIKWEKRQSKFGGHYLYGESDSDVSARNWDVNYKYEQELTDYMSMTFGEIIEGNRFTGIKARYNTDLGLKYYHIKTDAKKVFSEVSYRYSIEDRYAPEPNTYDNKARIYNEIEHKLSQTSQYKVWLEYIPNFTERDDYLVNFEASLISILNSVFSLKVSYAGMYDSRPVTADLKNYDYNTTTALVVKF